MLSNYTQQFSARNTPTWSNLRRVYMSGPMSEPRLDSSAMRQSTAHVTPIAVSESGAVVLRLNKYWTMPPSVRGHTITGDAKTPPFQGRKETQY